MKKTTLMLAWCFALTLGTAYGQETQNNQNKQFLKNYKAPAFKQKRFDIELRMTGASEPKSTNYVRQFTEFTNFGYSQYSNSQNYQGNLNLRLSSSINWSKQTAGENFSSVSGFRVLTVNRFYFKPKWFAGVHGNIIANHVYDDQLGQASSVRYQINANPTVSIGRGRVEPVKYARNAMDIERQLKKGNRLTRPYTTDQLKTIADRLAEINNVRFYDFRLRRIEQLGELDAVLRDVGGVSEFDIAYFANLADAYLYAQNFDRFSGFRHEIGLTQFGNMNFLVNNESHNHLFSSLAFYHMSYHLPASYVIQHTITASAIGGSTFNDSSNQPLNRRTEAWVTAGYELGLYPTTRTNFNFGLKSGVNLTQPEGVIELYTNGQVYLSPQFRLGFNLRYSPNSGYNQLYNSPIIPTVGATNPFFLSGNIGLTYAIF